jgi:hypothetical protein
VSAIKPAPVVSFPATGVPETRVTLYRRTPELGGPKVVVRRGKGQATRVRIHRGDWS